MLKKIIIVLYKIIFLFMLFLQFLLLERIHKGAATALSKKIWQLFCSLFNVGSYRWKVSKLGLSVVLTFFKDYNDNRLKPTFFCTTFFIKFLQKTIVTLNMFLYITSFFGFLCRLLLTYTALHF